MLVVGEGGADFGFDGEDSPHRTFFCVWFLPANSAGADWLVRFNFRDSGELFTGFELLLRALKRSVGCGGEIVVRRHWRASLEDGLRWEYSL